MTDFDLAEYEKIQPTATIDGVQFFVPNQLCLHRVNTLFSKEADTMEWISGFSDRDLLIDIGANVGMYSIWAAAKQGARVLAFEPESQNFAVLNRNIFINGLQDKISAYCVAIGGPTEAGTDYTVDVLNLSSFQIGTSCHSFSEEVDYKLDPATPSFKQGCIAVPLDGFLQSSGGIDRFDDIHIKIDVDGLEHLVVRGAEQILRSPQVRSVLIEINTNLIPHNEIVKLMESRGFATTIHPDAIRSSGKFEGLGNHIFVRR
ncbi:MAG: FkbM family methyltransferase [Rhodospirillales bacterium]